MKTTDYILSNPIEALIIDPIKDFINLFEPPKTDPDREKARLDVLGKRRLSYDIDPNDLDSADYPRRVDEWEHQYKERHRNDRTPAWKNWKWPTPQDAEQILAIMISAIIARKLAKRLGATEETAAAENRSVKTEVTKKGSGKTNKARTRSAENLEKTESKGYNTDETMVQRR